MLYRHWMIGTLRQFACQAGIASVFSRAVEGVELIIRIFPALSQDCEPLTRRSKEMLIVIEPDSLRFERKSCDRKLSYVQMSPMIFDCYVRQSFQSGLARRQQSHRNALRS